LKRNIRTIIIVAVLFVLLIGAYFFVLNLKKDGKGAGSNLAAEQLDYLIQEKLDEISYIQYSAGEESFTVYNKETPSIDGYKSHIIDPTKLETALMSTAGMSFSQNMGSQSDLSKYGLDKEDKFILFKLKDGKEHKIIIGNPTHLNGEYYARRAGEKVVYTLSAQSSALLMCDPGIFRDITVCTIDNYSISEISVKKAGSSVLEIKLDEQFAKDGGFIQSNYIVKYPYSDVEANNDTVNALFEKLTSVYATEIVEEDPIDLSVYGLDKPDTITVKDKKGTSVVKMGEYAEDGTVYIMKNDVPVVYKAVCSFYESVKNIVPDEYIARYIHIFKITDVESVVVENAGKTHTLKMKELAEDKYEYSIDGKIKAEDNFRSVYETIITPIANKIVGEKIDGEEVCKITFSLKNKNVKAFTYYQYDDKNYIVKADNGLTCLVKKESIDNIFKAFK
jgi:hypothetical protein